MWDVHGMLRKMGAKQFWEWAAYAELEPFGSEERADMRIAQLCALTANAHFKGKHKAEDFMLNKAPSKPKSRRPSSGQTKAWFQAVAAAFGGGGK